MLADQQRSYSHSIHCTKQKHYSFCILSSAVIEISPDICYETLEKSRKIGCRVTRRLPSVPYLVPFPRDLIIGFAKRGNCY